MPFPRHTLAEADALVAAAGFQSTSVDAAERCVDCRRHTRRTIVGGPFYCSAPAHVRRAIEVARRVEQITSERVAEVEAIADAAEPEFDEPVIVRAGEAAPLAQHDAPLDGEFREDAHGLRYLTAEEVAAESARRAEAGEPVATLAELEETVAALTPAEVTPEQVADAILDRRPILDLFPSRDLTREQADTVDAGVTIATERLAARYGIEPAEVVRLGREVVEETLAPAPVHYTREQVLDRLRETGGFDLVLGPDDTAYDPETGDTLLGGVTVRYARGEFPGPAYTATIERPELPVDDDPREQPAPVEWSETAEARP